MEIEDFDFAEMMAKIEENRIASLLHLELEQRRRKAFVDRHWRGNEKEFEIGKPVLVFQTRMGNMLRKLRFRWTGPFWITKEYNGSYQLGTLAGEILGKWVNGFRLKPYKGRMPKNLVQEDEDPQNPENRPEGGLVPGITDPVQPGTIGN